ITLSTGMIALTITFLDKIVQTTLGDHSKHVPGTLAFAWVLFCCAILFSLWTLGAITGTLDAIDRKSSGTALSADAEKMTIDLASGTNVTRPAILMAISF